MSRYIDAENLKEEIESLTIYCGGENLFLPAAKQSILRIIDEQATVQEVKRGKWEFHAQDTDGMSGYFACSNCHEVLPTDHSKTNYMQRCNFNYCPNCGAKMEV